jgi:queuine tRNA-ribosyltransferase
MNVEFAAQRFTIEAVDSRARVGKLKLRNGLVSTPAFMPVGTQAAVKALDPADIRCTGTEVILANTYHLMLRPGGDAISALGGVSHFMRWDGPVLTDSGGFQVFSLARSRTVSSQGVTFRSHIDGSSHHLTPERSIELQHQFGSDVSMALDVLAGYGATASEQVEATRLTHSWLPRNIEAFNRTNDDPMRLLFGICQGGFEPSKRTESAFTIAEANVGGCAIGGLSVGEPKDIMCEMLDASIRVLPFDRPRYLMGVGSPEDLWNCVSAGVDMFDCVLPSRVARHGALFTTTGRVNINSTNYRLADDPVDADCDCTTCRGFSAAYVHHLFRTKELLAYRLATIHNLRFIQRQMSRMRDAIRSGTFDDERRAFLSGYQPADQSRAAEQRRRFQHARNRD